MKMCHTQAMKLLKELAEQKSALLAAENKNCTISYREGEEKTACDYDYAATRAAEEEIDERVLRIRSALAHANCTVKVDFEGLTLAEALVLLAQLQNKRRQLEYLAGMKQLSRRITENGTIEYTEKLFDVKEAAQDAKEVRARIGALQIAIDRANLNNYIEV